MNTSNVNSKVYEGFVVYFRRDGQKRYVIKNNPQEVQTFKRQLKVNRRKFLGSRRVVLQEV